MFYIIYKITNLVNNKIYIGKHKTDNLNDSYMGSGKLIQKAINKYSIENFKKEILYIFNNEKDMIDKEAYIVNEGFIKRPDTYNIETGGGGGDFTAALAKFKQLLEDPGWHKQYKDKMQKVVKDPKRCEKASKSLKRYYETHDGAMKGKHHTEETKRKMREIAKNNQRQKGKNNSMYGKRWISHPVTKEVKLINKEELQIYLDKGFINKKNPDSKYKQYQGGKYVKLDPEQKKKNIKTGQLKRKQTLKAKGKQLCYINKQTSERRYFSEGTIIDLTIWEPTWSKFKVEEVEKFLQEGKSWNKIAEYYNTTYWSVYTWYKPFRKKK